MHSHACIKCGKSYKDKDPEPYYCKTCNNERKLIAKTVDEKLKGRISKRKTVSALQEYENSTDKVGGFIRVRL